MQSPITLEALHILDAIERRGSFAAAANELDRAPSSLSYQIQKLEQELDIMILIDPVIRQTYRGGAFDLGARANDPWCD